MESKQYFFKHTKLMCSGSKFKPYQGVSTLKSHIRLLNLSWLPIVRFGQQTVNSKEASGLCLVQNKHEIILLSVIQRSN